ncbi:MAG: DUF3883 domain-containing protein [Chitinophagaceae bacterium]
MKIPLVKQYIASYKKNFGHIDKEEIYKWKAVKHFQDNWDINATNFPVMLKNSIKKTRNLLKSGQYFPLRMIMNYVDKEPEKVRDIFADLYDEQKDIEERLNNFQNGVDQINDQFYPGKNTYQDHRAIIVYLTLRYPEIYYLFKFEMYKTFAQKLDLIFKPKAGKIETVRHFNKVCNIVRHYISQDQELLKLHKDRITNDCYYDENLHLLTQDFIYAVTRHLENIKNPALVTASIITTTQVISAGDLVANIDDVNFNGRFVNFIENSIEAKRIGDLGEIWVYEQEKKKLSENGFTKLAEKVTHISNDNGDGTGYDIESYDINGNKIFIEVKTTKNSFNSTFYISRNELERSKREGDSYYLYRVYNFNDETNEAEYKIIRGDLTNLCTTPVTYKVTLKPR